MLILYPVQGDVNIEWACRILGVEVSFRSFEQNQGEIDNLRNDFINILQFSAENSIPEYWNNFYIDSMGYFGIRKQDLKNREFNNTVLTFQNS